MIPLNKAEIRELLKERREAISAERRKNAEKALISDLLPKLGCKTLSFCSLSKEIQIGELNEYLAKQGNLYLPKVENEDLLVYKVKDLRHLILGQWSLWEPNPQFCELVDPSLIECVLVPGLGFDTMCHRIGYGKGYYDRLLTKTKNAQTIGVGFQEQLYAFALPTLPHDVQLGAVHLY